MSEEQQELSRIVRRLGVANVVELLADRLSGSDLNTLLLEVFRQKTKSSAAADLLNRYKENRFVKPAVVNALDLKRLELNVLQIADRHGFAPIQLSPLAPLGSCSIVATADQNKIVSALRGTEVVGDATNLLALHVSEGLKSGALDNRNGPLRFCTTHRHVRAQQFRPAPDVFSHFHLFCLVSSGVDRGSYSFETSVFVEHIDVYKHLFRSLFDAGITVSLRIRSSGYKDSEGLVRRIVRHAEERLADVPVFVDTAEEENRYYKGLQFTVRMNSKESERAIGDGGFVDWTQQLTGNRKERFMISAIGLERLLL